MSLLVRRVFVNIVILIALLLSGLLTVSTAGQKHPNVWITFPARDVMLVAELLDTEEEQHIGLAGRDSLDVSHGMLFISKQEERTGVWMKGMRFPIDILWFNSDYSLVSVAKNVDPDSYPAVYWPDEPAKYILEVRGGFVTQYNISFGDRIIINYHPQSGQSEESPRRGFKCAATS